VTAHEFAEALPGFEHISGPALYPVALFQRV